MTKKKYAAYLASSHWQQLRKEYLDEASECEKCAIPRWFAEIAYDQDLHLHHLSYQNLGKEGLEDLQVLCRRCHDLETFGRTELREPKRAQCEFCAAIHWNYRSHLCPICVGIFNTSQVYDVLIKKLPWSEETASEYLTRIFGQANG
jgi:hypothetical protein